MKQIIQNYKTGEVKVEEVPAPILKKGGVIVRTSYSVISIGTERSTLEISKKSILGKAKARPDLVKQVLSTVKKVGFKKTFELVMNRLDTPVPLGYSLSGIVEEVSDDIEGLNVGDLVACAGAGYANHAEKVFVPKNLVNKIPKGISQEQAAFTALGSISLHAVRQAGVSLGDRVGVLGLGLVGQITGGILKAQGCKVLGIDLRESVINFSKKMGFDIAVLRQNPSLIEIIRDFTNELGFDAIIIAAGANSNDPFQFSSEILRDKGTLVIVGGIRMEIVKSISSLFYQKEIDIKFSRSYGPGRYDLNYEEKGIDYPVGFVRWTEKRNMECFLDLLSSGKLNLNALITNIFPFEDALKAYRMIERESDEPYLAILLDYTKGNRPEPQRIFVNKKKKSFKGKIKIGMIGAGNFAQANLLPYLKNKPDIVLKGICTLRGITAKRVADKYGFLYCCSNPNELLNDEDIEVIFITTRHDTHARYVVEALDRRKHVFVEKPLCLNELELEEIIKAYTRANETNFVSLMVGYNRRFAPLSIKLKSLFKETAAPITIIYRVNAGYIPHDQWYQYPDQGGRFIGEGCHFVDFGHFLADSRPARLNCFGIPGRNQPLYQNDNLAITIQMEDSSLLTIIYNSSGDVSMPKERIEVFGSNSSAVLDDFRSIKFFKGGKAKNFRNLSQNKGFENEINSYVRALKEGDRALISFSSLVSTSLSTFAAIESLKKGIPIEIRRYDFDADQ